MSTQAHTPGPPRPHSRRRFVESPAAAVRYSRKAGFFRSGRETPEPTPPGILWRAAWYPVAADGRRAEGNPPPRCDAPAAPVPGWGWGGEGYRYLEVDPFWGPVRFGRWEKPWDGGWGRGRWRKWRGWSSPGGTWDGQSVSLFCHDTKPDDPFIPHPNC